MKVLKRPHKVRIRRGEDAPNQLSLPPEPPSSGDLPTPNGPGSSRWWMAWGVHFYTALGLVLASAIAALLVYGGPAAFRWCFVLMAIATLVDATDGTMARRVDVKRVLPNFDGRKLDDLTDFLTYTFLPLLLIWRAQLLPPGYEGWLLLALLASAYGFCQAEAKTDDGYFLGFPSLWNVVAFYLYTLQLPPFLALAIIIVLALMTFVPSRYLYPSSQPGLLNTFTNLLAIPWTLVLCWLLWRMPYNSEPSGMGLYHRVAILSMYYPIYYMAASWAVTLRRWQPGSNRGTLA